MDNFNQADLFADILPPMPSKNPKNKSREKLGNTGIKNTGIKNTGTKNTGNKNIGDKRGSARPFQRNGSISKLPTLPENLPVVS